MTTKQIPFTQAGTEWMYSDAEELAPEETTEKARKARALDEDASDEDAVRLIHSRDEDTLNLLRGGG